MRCVLIKVQTQQTLLRNTDDPAIVLEKCCMSFYFDVTLLALLLLCFTENVTPVLSYRICKEPVWVKVFIPSKQKPYLSLLKIKSTE